MDQFMDAAKEAARQAGKILNENLRGVRTISYKGAIDLVTEMDVRSEKIIVETLLSAFPEHGILAEEGSSRETSSPYRWIIDPLDGTTNYAHGYPCFCVSIALQMRGDTILGVIYDPTRDELFAGLKGGGAEVNGVPLRVSNNNVLLQSLLATGFPYDRRESERNNLDFFNRLLLASQEVRRDGSAALDLCQVAAGRFDGFWELKLKPWDVAAGILIVREAGGRATDFAGADSSVHDAEIIASNGLIHDQMLGILTT